MLAAGIAVGALMVVGFIRWVDRSKELDLNPKISDADILGRWRTESGSASIVFRSDHTFMLGADSDSERWELNAHELIVGRERWRPVRKRSELRLVRNPPLDWDEWDGDLGSVAIDERIYALWSRACGTPDCAGCERR